MIEIRGNEIFFAGIKVADLCTVGIWATLIDDFKDYVETADELEEQVKRLTAENDLMLSVVGELTDMINDMIDAK